MKKYKRNFKKEDKFLYDFLEYLTNYCIKHKIHILDTYYPILFQAFCLEVYFSLDTKTIEGIKKEILDNLRHNKQTVLEHLSGISNAYQ